MSASLDTHRPRFASLLVASATAGLVLASFLSLSDRPAPAADTPGKATVKFEMLPSNHMVVRARINGKGPYRLVFDLGAPITLLSNRAGEASGVVKAEAPRSFLFSMRGEAEVKTLEVGDLTARDVPVIVFDHPLLKALGGFFRGPLDGIMGYTFFARYRTTIDYQARTMTFEPVDYEVRNLLKDLPERMAGPRVARRRVLRRRRGCPRRPGRPRGRPPRRRGAHPDRHRQARPLKGKGEHPFEAR